jgi:hypothetical protein
MYSYGGYHGTLNVTRKWNSMKNGIWPPSKKMRVSLTRKQWAELNKMEFWKWIRGYEACISQIRRQKTNLKSRQNPEPNLILQNNAVYSSCIHWDEQEYFKTKQTSKTVSRFNFFLFISYFNLYLVIYVDCKCRLQCVNNFTLNTFSNFHEN